MSTEKSHILDVVANNVMFSIIFIFGTTAVVLFTVVSLLIMGSMCVDYWHAPMILEWLRLPQVVVWGGIMSTALTVLTNGFWFKALSEMYKPLFKARIEHLKVIKR